MAEEFSEALAKEERKKRFLLQLSTSPPSQVALLLAERLFSIEDFQEIQNHNSTKALQRMDKIEATQKWQMVLLLPVALAAIKVFLFGQTSSMADVISIIKTIFGL